MAIPKYKYLHDYIADRNIYKAVCFASKMIRQGRAPQRAIRIAAHYYGVDMSEVAHYVAQKGGRINAERRI